MKRFFVRLKPYRFVLGIAALLLLSLFLLSQSLQTAQDFTNTYGVLMLVNVIGASVLLIWLGISLIQLWQDSRQQAPGAKLQLRLVGAISLLIGIPMLVAFFFARHVIHQSVDTWFDTQTEQVLQDALNLSRSVLDLKTRDNLNRVTTLVQNYQTDIHTSPTMALPNLAEQLGDKGADLALFSSSGQIVAAASLDASPLLPQPLPESIMQQVRQGTPYAAMDAEPLNDGTLTSFIRVALPVRDNNQRVEFILQVQFHLPDELRQQADRVAHANSQYQTIAFLRDPLKVSVTINLALVVLLTLLGSVLAGIQASRSFIRPISELTLGARTIASGDYSQRLDPDRRDELGDLMHTFNDMSEQIQKSRDELRRSQLTAEGQKRYLQILLNQITAGVLTCDANGKLRTANHAATKLLGNTLDTHIGMPLQHLLDAYPNLAPFVQAIETANASLTPVSDDSWQNQITLESSDNRTMLMLHIRRLPDLLHTSGGILVVFDDITAIVQAQRYATWQDIARRLAHEIKNPLTPIQLAADRLRHKLLAHLPEEDAKLLDRATNTIIQQVDSMKRLVQDFADFAKSPKVMMHATDINSLIQDIIIMYPLTPQQRLRISTDLDAQCIKLQADAGRLRQLFHNLIKNAREATDAMETPQLHIQTHCDEQHLHLTLTDNGPGIPEEQRHWIFEPYATNKPKGTGLGMAIVKRILDEHNAHIHISQADPQGAIIHIQFPFKPTGQA
jgi:nitrogen fixation/metabolism regulation signal transduction histidine kinase